jgi:uncharacterized phiE125 gp8 family phage protein
MPGLSIKTQPTSEPISRAQAKAHLRVDFDDDDALIDILISSARSKAESFLKASILPTVYLLKLNSFPSQIDLPIGPVATTTGSSVTYVNDAGTDVTLPDTLYQFSIGEYACIRPSYGNTWPSTRPQLDAVTVEFTAGWSAVASVPPAIIAAIYLIIGDLYENRESTARGDTVASMPLGAENLLTPFIRH